MGFGIAKQDGKGRKSSNGKTLGSRKCVESEVRLLLPLRLTKCMFPKTRLLPPQELYFRLHAWTQIFTVDFEHQYIKGLPIHAAGHYTFFPQLRNPVLSIFLYRRY